MRRVSFLVLAAVLLLAVGVGCASVPQAGELRSQAIDLIAEAERACAGKEWQKAVTLYLDSLILSPRPRAYYGLGVCYQALGEPERAAHYLRQARSLAPDYRFGLAPEQRDREEKAGGAPATTPTLEQVRRVLFAPEEEQEELAFWEAMGEKKEVVLDSVKYHLSKAREFREHELLPEAIREYQEYLRLCPDCTTGRKELAEIYCELGRVERAREVLEAGSKMPKIGAECRFLLGNFHLKRGELEEAKRIYEGLLQAKFSPAKVWNNLGIIHLRQGKLEEAERCWRQAITEDEELADAWRNLGLLYQGNYGKTEEGAGYLERARRLEEKREGESEKNCENSLTPPPPPDAYYICSLKT